MKTLIKGGTGLTPKISVIMPVYNGEKFLREAIESILNQTYSDFEFIIANDGSTDKTLDIIIEYQEVDPRIVILKGEKQGLVKTLNDAIQISKGDYIARMDADDISFSRRFEKQIELIEKEKLDICGCHYLLINESGKCLDTVLTPIDDNGLILYLAIGVPFAHGSVMFRKDFMLTNNLRYGQGVKFAEDKALWIAMYKNSAKFSNVNEILFKYREYSGSLSKTGNSKIRIDDELLKSEILEFCYKDIYRVIDLLSSNVGILNYREIEYLADVILYLTFRKLNLKFLKFIRRIPVRYSSISALKFLVRIIS